MSSKVSIYHLTETGKVDELINASDSEYESECVIKPDTPARFSEAMFVEDRILETSGDLFDSYHKYESEQEEELAVKPTPLELKNDYSDCSSQSSGLKITLNQCEMASNSSSAMTPRIIKEQERKQIESGMKINSEIDFTTTMKNKTRLSPEQITRIREITDQRRKDIELEYSNNSFSQYPSENAESTAFFEPGILDSDRDSRKEQIIERLENLL